MFAVSSVERFPGNQVYHFLVNAQVVQILFRRRCSLEGKYNGKGGIGRLETGYRVGFCAMSLLNGSMATGGSFGLPGHSGPKWGSIAQTKRGNVLTGI